MNGRAVRKATRTAFMGDVMLRNIPSEVWAFDVEWVPDVESGRRRTVSLSMSTTKPCLTRCGSSRTAERGTCEPNRRARPVEWSHMQLVVHCLHSGRPV